MWNLYGLKNCDACRKASVWLKDHRRPFVFHDLRAGGLAPALLDDWERQAGWGSLLNRQGTTWRGLPDIEKADLDKTRALELMLRHPSLIKRPILAAGDVLLLGFSAERYALLE